MQDSSGRRWAVGTVANGHVLTAGDGWVRLNGQVDPAGPPRPGDVIDGRVYTGAGWSELPGAWMPDPTGRHQLRWWTGRHWGRDAMTHGLRYVDPITPPAYRSSARPSTQSAPVGPFIPPRSPQGRRGFWDVVDRIAVGAYCGFWLLVAIYSASIAVQEQDYRFLTLTATASMNVFLFSLTGRKKKELQRDFRRAVKAKLPYLLCGALAAGGIWLSLHFDDPQILTLTVVVVGISLMFAWVFS